MHSVQTNATVKNGFSHTRSQNTFYEGILFLPMPTFDESAFYHRQTQRSSHNLGHLSIGVDVGSGEWRDIDWVANWLIAR